MRALAPAALLFATACMTGETTPPPVAAVGQSALYRCADGRDVDILFGGDAAVLTIAGQPVQMTTAVSASGARYTGGGWQWWSKGTRTGTLAPLAVGEDFASAPGTSCSIR